MTAAASTKRQKTETSGATEPTCPFMAIQLNPQAKTVAP